MKKVLLLLLTLLFVACQEKSKSDNAVSKAPISNEIKWTILNYKDIGVKAIKLGDSLNMLRSVGKPDSIGYLNSDFDMPDLVLYYFKSSYFGFDKGKKLYSFDIKDPAFILQTFNVKIGDQEKYVTDRIMKSFLNPKSIVSIQDKDTLKVRIGQSDDYLLFHFRNAILNEYDTWSDR